MFSKALNEGKSFFQAGCVIFVAAANTLPSINPRKPSMKLQTVTVFRVWSMSGITEAPAEGGNGEGRDAAMFLN